MQINPIKVVLIYLVAGLVWVFLGPLLVNVFTAIFTVEPRTLEIYKGVFFILFTAGVLFFTMQHQQRLLVASERHYKSLFLTNPTALWIYDLDSMELLEANAAATKLSGYSIEEIKKMTLLDLFVDHRRLAMHPWGDYEFLRKDKEIIVARVSSHQIRAKRRNAMLMMAEDVTQGLEQERMLKLAYATERELKEELEKNIVLMEQSLDEKRRLAEIIDRIHNMVMITDPEGVITWVNQAFINQTGFSFEEAVGRTPAFLHGPDADRHLERHILEGIKSRDFALFEVKNFTKSGEPYWVGITITAVYNEDGKVVRYISIENVITEQKLNDERIRKQNEVLKKVAWTNSHAIRKPVTSILSLVDLCKGTFDIAEIKKFNALIEVCAQDLDDVTKEVGREIDESDIESA